MFTNVIIKDQDGEAVVMVATSDRRELTIGEAQTELLASQRILETATGAAVVYKEGKAKAAAARERKSIVGPEEA